MQGDRSPLGFEEAHHRIAELAGCRWSLAVLLELRAGPRRPADLRRSLDGISPKVLHDRLNRLLRYGLAERTRRDDEKGLHAEYALTGFGQEVAEAFCELNRLAQKWPPDLLPPAPADSRL